MPHSEVIRVGAMTPLERRLINSLSPEERKKGLLVLARQKLAEENAEMLKRAAQFGSNESRPVRTISDEEASQLDGFYCGVDN